MPDLNQQFQQDARSFARTRALYPWQSPSFVLSPDHLKERTIDPTNDLDVAQVQGDNKVCYCDIKPAMGLRGLTGDFMEDYSADAGLYVMQIGRNPFSATSFPVYYLPYAPNRTTRMKLKPSRKHARVDSGSRVMDPDVFVTAALQGCSIFVDGTPDAPVVYHLNAAGFGGEMSDGQTEREALQLVQRKEAEMRRRHQLAQTLFPKEGPASSGHAPAVGSRHAEASMSDYIPQTLTPSRRQELVRSHTRNWRTLWGWLGGWNARVSQVGTVFGVRTSGEWAFYRQTRVRVSYDVAVPNEAPYGPPVVERETFWAGVTCVQFWPVYRG